MLLPTNTGLGFSPKGQVREGVKNIQRGGSLKYSAEGCKTLTPPKNSLTGMYPPINCQQQLRPSPKFLYHDMDPA